MKKNITLKTMLPGIILLVLSICLTIGVKTVFHACIHEDGTEGTCHWAQQAIFAFGILMCVESIILILAKGSEGARWVGACVFFSAVLCALLPDVFMRLCMMPAMHCRAYMKPWTIIICVIIAIVSIISFVISSRSGKETKN